MEWDKVPFSQDAAARMASLAGNVSEIDHRAVLERADQGEEGRGEARQMAKAPSDSDVFSKGGAGQSYQEKEGSFVWALSVEDRYWKVGKMNNVHARWKTSLFARAFGKRLSHILWNCTYNNRCIWYCFIICNVVGNFFTLFTLMGYFEKWWCMVGTTVGLPLTCVAIMHAQTWIVMRIVWTFEYAFLTFSGILYCMSMAYCFRFDERVSVLVLWFLGMQCFLLLDAIAPPRKKKDALKALISIYSVIYWSSIVGAGLLGFLDDVHAPNIKISLSYDQDESVSFNPLSFANQRMVTIILFSFKYVLSSIYRPNTFVMLKARVCLQKTSNNEMEKLLEDGSRKQTFRRESMVSGSSQGKNSVYNQMSRQDGSERLPAPACPTKVLPFP